MSELTSFRDLALVLAGALGGGLLAHFLKLPLFLGYIVGGVLVGPFTPGLKVEDPTFILLLAQIGIVLLMFSMGLEFSLKDLMRVGAPAILGGLLGMSAMMLIFLLIGRVIGLSILASFFIGAGISVSSTMVIAKLLMERDELTLEHGRLMIGTLLVEDLAVVVLLVLLPALSQFQESHWQDIALALLKAVGILVPVIFLAIRAVPQLVERIARTGNFELFILVSLVIGIGTAVGTSQLGLSTAMGAFLAGILISESDYVHQTLARILPLRDLFVALFFVSLGMLIDPSAILQNWPLCLLLIGLAVIGKGVIRGLITWLFRYPLRVAFFVALGFTQIGEFSFVLAQVGVQANAISSDQYNVLIASSLVTIFVGSLLFRSAHPWWAAIRRTFPWVEKRPAEEPDDKAEQKDRHVILFGYGRIGRAVGAALDQFKVPYIVVEADSEIVGRLKERSTPFIFGDASSFQITQATHPERAVLAVIALRVFFHIRETFHNVKRINPDLPVLVRAHWEEEREQLFREGVSEVIQPEFEAAIEMIRHTLVHVGVSPLQMESYLDSLRQQRYGSTLRQWLQREDPFHKLQRLQEITLPDHSPLVGNSLRGCNIRDRLGVSVIQVQRKSGETFVNPPADLVLESGDKLLVMGSATQLVEMIEMSRSTNVESWS
ncbi:cation:proton antiporter [Candidatus Acetothermia bacterium]|nr:cation:proton antiporter [Candidatus Acetothermia bacterium]MBI3643057.1 cation:proton antiporter [Candidatus Acetothermia bacterium]